MGWGGAREGLSLSLAGAGAGAGWDERLKPVPSRLWKDHRVVRIHAKSLTVDFEWMSASRKEHRKAQSV